jgi:ribonuclease P protein component
VLPKKNRIVKDLEIKKAFRTKYRLVNQNFGVFIRKNDSENFQLLVVVSKKIFKKANRRNLLRRRIISIFQHLKSTEQLPKSISVIVQVRSKDLISLDYNELKSHILDVTFNLYQKLH